MKALFLGGSQHGVLLNLYRKELYWDFPIIPKLSIGLRASLPNTVQNLDVVRYKMAMHSLDWESAIYTECGDAIDVLTHVNSWISDADPAVCLMMNREPQPVYLQPRKEEK